MSEPDEAETIDLRIAEIVAAWMEMPEANRTAANELINQHPELAPALAECLRGLEQVEQGKAVRFESDSQEIDFADHEVEFPAIPDFQVIGELGRGGMGVVYEAKQNSLDRFVALKVLPSGAVDARAVKRFLREAETVASLSHPGIVPVYAVGVHDGLNWYAMQRIEGCPLSQWFAVATFSSRGKALDEVVRVGIEAAEALQYAHTCGVIHRDVKPGNLLVDTTSKVWLADFGLARRDVDVTATATGAMLGTPRYMSAEQISGFDDDIDARTDIYSLGATLYEMATGRPPFASDSPLELLTQIQRDEPSPPRQLDPSIPRTLELVLLKCLDKERARRYESAAELADDLKAIRDHQPISARGLPMWVTAERFLKRNNRQVNAIATSVLATVAMLMSLGLLWQQYQQSKLGSVQINTPAGLYVASIQPRDVALSASRQRFVDAIEPTLVTTPMQQKAELPAGDYVVRLEGDGNHSQNVEMSVAAGETTELEYIDRRESPPSVDIHNKLAMPLGHRTLAVLGKEKFEVFDSKFDAESRSKATPVDADSMRRFSLPIAELDAGLAEAALAARPKDASDQGDPPLTFAFDPEQTFQGDYSVPRSSFSRITRIATSEFDLNEDGDRDYIVTAARHAAVAAISSDGSVLWKRHLPMSFEIAEARSRNPKNGLVNEAIVGIHLVDDLDDDGTKDFIVNASLFDPSGFTRPYIFTLSGRSGEKIAVAPLPTIDMNTNKSGHWPWRGLLPYRRTWNSGARANRGISYYHRDRIIKRATIHRLDHDHWGGNSASSALYVMPPLILEKTEGQTVATTALRQSIHFIDTSNGSPAATPIALKHPICRGPTRVKLKDGSIGVLVLTGRDANSFSKCFLELCVLGETMPRWSVMQDVSAPEFVAGAADTSFPWAVDLDNDGSDEILTSTDRDYPSQWPQVQCYSAETGKLKWVSQGISGLASVAEHARTVGDIDRDGHLDFALAGLSSQDANRNSLQTAGLSLVVDFISGRTGQRLGYRDEWITRNFEKSGVTEIDSVEVIGNELMCSVVHGQVDELKLSSTTITMDLTQAAQSVVSRGLTSLALPGGQGARSSGRWYRRRSGPYSNPGDAAVWIDRSPIESRFSGESLIASWVTPDRGPRVFLSDKNAHARCVDPCTGNVQWERDKFYTNHATFTLPAADGATDLLRQVDDSIEFLDAATGRLRFKIATLSIGVVRQLELDGSNPERFVYAIAERDPAAVRQSLRLGPRGFKILKIDRQEQRIVWAQRYLDDMQTQGRWWKSELIQADVNADGITDAIFGDVEKGNVVLRALDGRDGESIWSARMELIGSEMEWPRRKRWPLMTTVSSGSVDFIVVVDAVDGDHKSMDVKALRLQDGRVTANLHLPIQNPPVFNSDISIVTLSPKKRDGQFAVRRGINYSGFFSTVFKLDESGSKISEVNSFRSSWDILDADIDHDQTLERIDVIDDKSVEIRRNDTNELLGSFELPGKISFRRVDTFSNKSFLVGWEQGHEHWWFELPSGRVALRSEQGLATTTHTNVEYPRLLQYDGGTLLVGKTPEGPLCIGVDLGLQRETTVPLASTSIEMTPPQADPRYKRALRFDGMYAHRSFAQVVSLSARATAAIILPLLLVLPPITTRRCSLRRLLLAPPVAILAMISWRSILAQQRGDSMTNFTIGVVTVASVWGVCTLLRDQRWKSLGAVVLISCVLAGLLMLLQQATFSTQSPGMVGYWKFGSFGLAVLSVLGQVVMPIVWAIFWFQKLISYLESKQRRRQAKPLVVRSP
ncbi:MAG: protein kinase [Pirellulaceae bacterium]